MSNRLASATSPYLLQHQDNPVDWYEWGEEAFEAARSRDVPLFLSIGYAACHWCHVMAHESFEDDDVAAYLNEHFVSIKVDREERPDIDAIYMEATQAMTGHGGWPMTCILTSDGAPFFAGTYYPPQPRLGMPGFRQVLEAVVGAWQDRRAEVTSISANVAGHLQQSTSLPPAESRRPRRGGGGETAAELRHPARGLRPGAEISAVDGVRVPVAPGCSCR
ncbi:MAG: thioredoxin domain-containing protein [Nocardioidaceae bacterium]